LGTTRSTSDASEGVLRVEVFDAGVFLGLFVGVVAGADHRAAFHDADAEGEAELFPVGELVGVGPALDFEVLRGGLEISPGAWAGSCL